MERDIMCNFESGVPISHVNRHFEEVGAKAVQGQAYLPGSDEKEE